MKLISFNACRLELQKNAQHLMKKHPNTYVLFLYCRKMNLRDLKVLQRQEQKQGMELMSKIRRQWEAQEQRFEQEMLVCLLVNIHLFVFFLLICSLIH